MLQVGDRFILYTRYGGVVKGEVKEIRHVSIICLKGLVCYDKPQIVSTEGVIYDLDGTDGKIYKIDKDITPEKAETFKKMIERMKLDKAKRKEDIMRRMMNKK